MARRQKYEIDSVNVHARTVWCILLGPACLAAACSEGESESVTVGARNGIRTAIVWRLAEDLRVGSIDGSGPDVFGSIRDVFPAVDGGLWILDSQAHELRLFNEAGQIQRIVGGPGEGPGEFAGNTCAFPGPEGEAWVEDGLARWQRFDSQGDLIGQLRSTSNIGCGIRRWTPDGRFFVVRTAFDPETREPGGYFLVHRLSPSGELSPGDTIPLPTVAPIPTVTWVAPGRRMSLPLPFVQRARFILGPLGTFWISDGGGSYSIRRQDEQGEVILTVQRDYQPVTIPEAERALAIQEFAPDGWTAEDGFDPDQVPRAYPPFDSYSIGTDGTLWVRRTGLGGAAALDAFATDGTFLGEVEVPGYFDRFSIRYATPDHLYGVLRDEFDVPFAVRFSVVR